ncbi:MAG TPA: glycogen debranching protein GlgX [Acidimicrobiales bacterium]|nr:glycogen debranching protein GlgX [Acidimicrobiales bacterium]
MPMAPHPGGRAPTAPLPADEDLMEREMSPGDPYPLGATWDGWGTNFAVFSQSAEAIELCLFDQAGNEERYELPEVDAFVWHGYIEGVEPGQLYGYRARGPYDPRKGLRANYAKLLLDPYAKAISGSVHWGAEVYGYPRSTGDDRQLDDTDSAAVMPKCIVVDTAFDWADDRHPHTPWHDTVIYETHVRGLTCKHPAVPPALRGTYAGVAHPEMIEHFLRLGITAVELMPVHQFVDDHQLVDRALRNYWGYNSIGFFAPHNGYASRSGQRVVNEFKAMVRALHAANIEVILDVVYNHTAEGDHLGPTLSFRGLDNPSYYRLNPADLRLYADTTGTGNTLNVSNPHTLQLLMDSLRYWVLEMHVDGFRFDLAATLARQFHEVDRLSAFFDLIHQDPVISRIKLIAEPWDLGSGGYQVGNFPVLWSEWNGRYRDSVRDYWRQQNTSIGELAHRLTGSSDLYEATGRRPWASVNFVTAHDGFTLVDLVTYNEKHNEANGEGNADGTDDNRSWNCGVEGPSDDPKIVSLRKRQARNFLASLAFSLGVPMLLGGDELGRSQRGNNNAYCQDNEVSWYDWDRVDTDLLAWVRSVLRLRRSHVVFTRRRFLQGRPLRHLDGHPERAEVAWFRPDGALMTDGDWGVGYAKSLGVFFNGAAHLEADRHGRLVRDTSFYLALNAWEQPLDFILPPPPWGGPWQVVVDTADERPVYRPDLVLPGAMVPLMGQHFVVLQENQEA